MAGQDPKLRGLVQGFYDMQKLRISDGNRVVANFLARIGVEASKRKDTAKKEGDSIIKKIEKEWRRVTDGMVRMPKEFKMTWKEREVVSEFTETCLIQQYMDLLKLEGHHQRKIEAYTQTTRLWTEFLKDVQGVGGILTGVLLSEIDISKAKYPSSLWMYAGLDVAADGAGRSRKKEHLVKRKYKDKNGEEKERDSITFNPLLKTKLTGVLGPSFLRVGNEKYRKVYDDYKHRLENHPKYGIAAEEKKDATKARRHNMSIRYMVKAFLIDLHVAWRKIEGLPVSVPYHEAKLGMKHSAIDTQ